MKTRIIFTALFLLSVLALFAGTANARGKEAAMVGYTYKSAVEETLLLENWMVNEYYWKYMEFNCFVRDFDSSAELEEWMTDITGWEVAVLTPATTEKATASETWMIQIALWEVFPFMQTETDSSLELERWMVSPGTWNSEEVR